jgi:F-type H+-transporting ATPase subunit gamma
MGLKDIKIRMQAIQKTANITQAMHNIALSKIKKSSTLIESSKLFLEAINDILAHTYSSVEDHPVTKSKHQGQTLYVLLTADRGLAGSYHNQLFKVFLETVKDVDPKTYQVFVIGKKGYYFAIKKDLPMINKEIIYNRDDISQISFRTYAKFIRDVFLEGFVDEVVLLYNHYLNTATQVVEKKTILPIAFDSSRTKKETHIYDVDPVYVLQETINLYVESSIFSALADAKLSEHAARMIAMKNATDNANEIVGRLHTMYHRARQQEITNELIDVVNGSNV